MDNFRLDRSATVALAWIGDAEFTLFVREAFLYEGIRDQRYLNNFVSREAHTRILFELRGVPVTRHLASELFEAAFASDPTFRLTVEAYVVKHIRARTYPGGSGVALAWQCEAGRIVAPSAFARYQGGVPTFARAEGAWDETMGEEREAGRLLGFTLIYRRLKRKVLGML